MSEIIDQSSCGETRWINSCQGKLFYKCTYFIYALLTSTYNNMMISTYSQTQCIPTPFIRIFNCPYEIGESIFHIYFPQNPMYPIYPSIFNAGAKNNRISNFNMFLVQNIDPATLYFLSDPNLSCHYSFEQ